MSGGWDRVEAMARSVGLGGGLEARVADPLWLLSRQWQVGEFRGDDAAQPAGVRVRGRSSPLSTFRAGAGGEPLPFPAGRPLEAVAEVTPEPGSGSAALHGAARTGRRLARMLGDGGFAAAVAALRAEFSLAPPVDGVEVGPAGRAATALLTRWGIDGAAVALAAPARLAAVIAPAVPAPDRPRAAAVLDDWREWYVRRGGAAAEERTWDDERLEYAFRLGARTTAGEVVLAAPEHTGDHLDWYAFDVATDPAAGPPSRGAPLPARELAAVPTPVRYAGMPASRWWEFEDGEVHFGDLDAGPADLARLLVAEFATSYGRDWFVVPVRVPVGSLTELESVEVVDTFGGRTPVPSAAVADRRRAPGAPRTWRLFELTGDEVGREHPSPWLFVPPSLVDSLAGAALERVAFVRDEAANLAWGIEQLVEGPLGRAVDRAEAWHTGRPPAPARGGPPGGDDWWWRYRLEATAPPWWIPFVAERVDPKASAEVRLRRSRMAAWELLGTGPVGPHSALLDPARPRWLYEEEVPRGGVRVERSWQLARWHDGSVHVWLQRRKRPGRGDVSSGVRWDLLDRTGPPDPPTI